MAATTRQNAQPAISAGTSQASRARAEDGGETAIPLLYGVIRRADNTSSQPRSPISLRHVALGCDRAADRHKAKKPMPVASCLATGIGWILGSTFGGSSDRGSELSGQHCLDTGRGSCP